MTSGKLLPFRTALKMILSDVLGVAAALFILVAIIGFKEGALYSPIIGSGIGTWLLIRIWDQLKKERRRVNSFGSAKNVQRPWLFCLLVARRGADRTVAQLSLFGQTYFLLTRWGAPIKLEA